MNVQKKEQTKETKQLHQTKQNIQQTEKKN